MPLLRQSLYAQNVNLYLAPTADGRDAWLSLMRTVALEGRCFVVSSNMCVRGSPAADSAPAKHEHGPTTNGGHDRPKGAAGRRNSCLTEDGFEIALPDRSQVSSSAVVEEGEQEEVEKENTPAPAKDPAPAGGSFVSRGGSSIVSPFGDVLAGPQWEDEEGIIYADADFDDCIRGRLDLDAAGSYSRYELFYSLPFSFIFLFCPSRFSLLLPPSPSTPYIDLIRVAI
ncbi:carbon-nitrogen hydrolase [Hypoxylon sp. NC1633]|nr:carbon-nitrogen hydrolase [Hypoxylon sp. NC1633]